MKQTVRKRKPRVKKHYPVPEALEGGPWDIKPSVGLGAKVGTGPDGNRLYVPLGDSEVDRFLRNHEMAHIKWSPKVPPDVGVPVDVLQGCEDARMHHLMRKTGMRTDARTLTPQKLAAWKQEIERSQQPELTAAALYASCMLTGNQEPVEDILDRGIMEVVDHLAEKHMPLGQKIPFQKTVDMAQELTRILGRPEDDEWGQKIGDDILDRLKEYMPRFDDHGHGWGRLSRIWQGKMTTRLPVKERSRRKIKKDRGTNPGAMQRWCQDGKIFVQKEYHKKNGGTTLVDVSGSMRLRPSDVIDFIRQHPTGTMAVYEGTHADGGTGEIRILAKNGRRLNDADLESAVYHKWGLNIIDGPALDWLGKQKGPRIWVSDGHVTGIGESQSRDLLLDAADKQRKYRIRRVENPRQALEVAEEYEG